MSKFGFFEVDTQFFNCYCDNEDLNFLESFSDEMDEFVIMVCTKLGLDFKNFKYSLEIFARREDHKRDLGVEEYFDWMEGHCSQDDNKIRLISIRDVARPERYRELIKHEIVHSVLYFYKINLPRFIDEGLAVWLSGQKISTDLNIKDYPQMINLIKPETFSKNKGYEYAGVYVEYLFKKIDIKNIKEGLGEDDVKKSIYPGFEKEAINWFLKSAQKKANNQAVV